MLELGPSSSTSVILISINATIQIVLFISGILFNIFILITFVKKETAGEDFFLFGIAVVDILLLIVTFTRFTVPLIIDFTGSTHVNLQGDSFGNALFVSVTSIAVWTCVATIGERYLTTVKPFRGVLQRWNHITAKSCRHIFILICVACEIFALPFVFEWYLLPRTSTHRIFSHTPTS